MRLRLLLLLAILVAPSVSRADDTADRLKAITAAFKAQTDSLKKDGGADFQAVVGSDALVSWSASDHPRTDFSSWNPVNADKIKVLSLKMGWAGTFGWLVADLKITFTWYAEPDGAGNPHPLPETHQYHYVAVFAPDGTGVKTKLVHVAEAIADKNLVAYDYAKALPALASPSPNVAMLATPSKLASMMSADSATTVFGTSPADKAHGGAAARKLLARWAKVGLEVVDSDPKEKNDDIFYKPVELTVGDATIVWARLRMKLGKNLYPVDGLAVLRKNGDKTEIVVLAYGGEQ
jgi:hypothetical protein